MTCFNHQIMQKIGKRGAKMMSLGVVLLLFAFNAQGQSFKREITFSNPNKPGTVRMELWYGDVTITGTQDKKVIVVYNVEEKPLASAGDGVSRAALSTDLEFTEAANVLRIVRPFQRRDFNDPMSVNVRMPSNTKLVLTSLGGPITIRKIQGEVEVTNKNGKVSLFEMANSALVNTQNGDILATFNRVLTSKSISLVSMNGDVDLTMPSTLQATVNLQTYKGEINSDFKIVRNNHPTGWGQRVIKGTIGTGATPVKLSSINGDIWLRRK